MMRRVRRRRSRRRLLRRRRSEGCALDVGYVGSKESCFEELGVGASEQAMGREYRS